MNKITRYIVSASFVVTTLSLSSCQKQIFEEPFTSLSPKDAFSTPARIEKAATGMYDQLQNAEFLGGRVLIYADIRGIDAGVPSYFGEMPKFNTLMSSDGNVSLAWKGAYRTIYEANNFIKNLSANSSAIPANQASQYIAEGKFIRSLTYFYLVNLWAQPFKFTADASHPGVPLVTEPAEDPFASSNQIARSSVAQVYNQMISDLTEAEANLPDADDSRAFKDVARATKGAAQGLLMRIYLYKGDYQKALEYADKLIASNKYALNAGDPVSVFKNYTTKESIFSIAHNGADNPNTNNALGQHYSPNLRADIPISVEYVNLLEVTDKRRSELITTVASKPGNFWTTKYTNLADWVPVLRYSEVLLTKAEALANISTTLNTEALGLVNVVRARSSASPIVPLTKDELITLIQRERRIELAFEGQGIFEFLRTGRGIPAHSTVVAQAYGSDYVVLPFPRTEAEMNPNLVQNKGY